MADEEVADAVAVLQVLHQVEHLGLHAHVERADRLVGDDQPRPRDERARDGDALALAAAELVRVLVGIGRAQADRVEHVGGTLALLGTAGAQQHGQRLGHRLADGAARVQRAVGVLKHHLQLYARPAQRRGVQAVQVNAFQQHAAGTGGFQRHHQPRQRALAGARLAHHAQAAAGLQAEADAGQRLHLGRGRQQVAARQAVPFGEVDNLQQGRQRWRVHASARRHRAVCAVPTVTTGGGALRQAGMTRSQRSA